jgi:GntR family transcriptional repressor for pyruvate dehydrogenase complex
MNKIISGNNLFAPIKSKRTFGEVCAEIKRLIFKGILTSSSKLPSESQLASRFNVGRQTVREALRLLEFSGFIAIQKGGTGGPIIIDPVLSKIGDLLLDAFQMKKITVDELTTTRLDVERAILNHVVKNAGDSDIKSLQGNIFKATMDLESGISPFTANSEFHNILAKASRNPILVIVETSIMTVVTDFLSRVVPDSEGSKRTIKGHQSILNAIIKRDREAAITLLEKHVLEVGDRFQRIIQQIHLQETIVKSTYPSQGIYNLAITRCGFQ